MLIRNVDLLKKVLGLFQNNYFCFFATGGAGGAGEGEGRLIALVVFTAEILGFLLSRTFILGFLPSVP
jgi:hypothetical protein